MVIEDFNYKLFALTPNYHTIWDAIISEKLLKMNIFQMLVHAFIVWERLINKKVAFSFLQMFICFIQDDYEKIKLSLLQHKYMNS